MKKIIFTLLLASGLIFSSKSHAQCDSSLWNYVYHSYRLIVHTQCTYVTGVIEDVYTEADGDWHIRVTLDSEYTYMLNAANISDEYGCLVCEPICMNTITQTDAIAPCAGDTTQHIFIPTIGEHVKITGSYVTDNDHGWNEIHPVSSITIFTPPPAGVATLTNEEDVKEMQVFPNPATSYVNFVLKEQPSSPVRITILDDQGRLAGQFQMWQMLSLKVPVQNLPNGVYHYHIEQDDRYIKGGTFSIVK